TKFCGVVARIWNDVLRYSDSNPVDLSSLRMVICGGSAVPRSLMERFEQRFGVKIIQAWGMTETSPLAAVSYPPKGCCEEELMDWRSKNVRIKTGVAMRRTGGEAGLRW